jgi:hypothetical protein
MYLVPWIWAAGVLHLLVASANFFAAHKLRYLDNLRRVTPIVRDVFIVQNVFIVFMLAGFALLCFLFAGDLTGPTALGRCLSGFLALFWGLRVLTQLFFYNAESKRQHPVLNGLFLATYIYLGGVFTIAALGWGS